MHTGREDQVPHSAALRLTITSHNQLILERQPRCVILPSRIRPFPPFQLLKSQFETHLPNSSLSPKSKHQSLSLPPPTTPNSNSTQKWLSPCITHPPTPQCISLHLQQRQHTIHSHQKTRQCQIGVQALTPIFSRLALKKGRKPPSLAKTSLKQPELVSITWMTSTIQPFKPHHLLHKQLSYTNKSYILAGTATMYSFFVDSGGCTSTYPNAARPYLGRYFGRVHH